jgi:hypothetical protein
VKGTTYLAGYSVTFRASVLNWTVCTLAIPILANFGAIGTSNILSPFPLAAQDSFNASPGKPLNPTYSFWQAAVVPTQCFIRNTF